jgi:signal transduction histidine kinase/PAS domain-containing protein
MLKDASVDHLFDGPGEMRALCRDVDWSATPLGPPASWPTSLRTTVATMLASRHPMFLFWGPDLVQIFNDAYRPSFASGGRHLRALGARGREFWTEIWDIIGPQIVQVMGGGESTWHEDQLVPIERNGRIEDVWWTYSYSPAFDDDGRVAGVLVVCQETTAQVIARRQMEDLNRALELERSRLATAFAQAPSFLAIVGGPPNYYFEFANEAYERLVGHRDLPGRRAFDVMPEAREQGFEALLDHVVATGESYVGREMPILLGRTAGQPAEERLLDFVYFPMVEPDGTRSGVIAHGVDVTDHVRARQEVERLLGESEAARLHAESGRERTASMQALTAALASASTTDQLEEAIVTHTAAAFGAVGVVVAGISVDGTHLELLGSRHMPDDIRESWRRFPISVSAPLADAVRTGEAMFLESRADWAARYPELEPLLEATGHHANIVAPLVVDQRVLGVVGAAFDRPRVFSEDERAAAITIARQCAQALERARLFEAEREARHAAEAANRAKGEFLAVMSHELRTPLNAIGGYAELIELGIRGPVTEQQREDLGRIQKSQRHLLGLINGVLNYSRVEAGAVRYALRDVKVDEVLATCEALVTPQMSARNLTLVYERCSPSACVRADAEKLQQIVLNLLTNSLKFTEARGRIDLWCDARRDEVRICVRDTGRGIATDQLNRVFEPFVQVDAGFTRTQEGVGLGLAISRDLARGMGGDLVAESVLGAGSTFTLILPAA